MATATVERREHFMYVLTRMGDTRVTWDPDDADSVAVARANFAAMRTAGYHMFRVAEDGTREHERVTEFDPGAQEYAMLKQVAGG